MNADALKEVFLMASLAGRAGDINVLDLRDDEDASSLRKGDFMAVCIPPMEDGESFFTEQQVATLYDCFIRISEIGGADGDFGGRVLLSWSGYSTDEREIWQIPEVVLLATMFCSEHPWILRLLVDENHPELKKMIPDDRLRFESFPGRWMFSSLALPQVDYIWRMGEDQSGVYGVQRNLTLNEVALTHVLEKPSSPPEPKLKN